MTKAKDSITNRILGLSPYIEIATRYLYRHSNILISSRKKVGRKTRKKQSYTLTPFKRILDWVKAQGVRNGDLLILVSGMDGLKPAEITPKQVIGELKNIIGLQGTLAMPTIPFYKEKAKGKELLSQDVSNMVFEYNVKKTLAWTGKIPNVFLRYPGTIRSRHPLNTMAANGPLASEMMKNNLLGDRPLPCGENSSWKYCADRNAKILCLGTDLTHSLTMIHVAEDVNPDKWPIKNWHRDRKFRLVEGNDISEIVVRERHPKWAMNFAERTLCKDLENSGILLRDLVGDVKVEIIKDSKRLLNYLNNRNGSGYPYYFF